MPAEKPGYVLDSFALLAHLQKEGGQPRMVELLQQAQRGQCRLWMSLINLGEVCYLVERRRGLRAVQLMLADVQSLPIEMAPADQEAVLAAAHLKAGFPISYADAFAAATAQMHHAILLTGDPEFKALGELLQVEWLAYTAGMGDTESNLITVPLGVTYCFDDSHASSVTRSV